MSKGEIYMTKKLISILLVVVTLFSVCAFSISAASRTNAFDVLTSSKYAKVYTISKSGTTIPYTSKYLTRRGTTSGASSSAYIDNASDELHLLDAGITNDISWAYVSFPIGSGKRRNAYIKLSAITAAKYGNSSLYYASSKGKFYCSPRKGGSTSSSYYVDTGDTVYLLYTSSSSGTYCQIMYPVSGGKWRIAWCTYENVKKYLRGVSSSSSNNANTLATLKALSEKLKNNSSSSSSNSTSSSSYSVSNNVVTLKGVRLYEYPIGSKVPSSSYYFNVNGKSTYVAATKCYGFACYCEMKLYGSCYHTNSSHFPNLSGSVNVKPNASELKSLITRAGAGSHLRTKSGHSMIIANVTSSGFTVIDANANNDCKVKLRTYTWDGYLNSYFGRSGIKWIEYHS